MGRGVGMSLGHKEDQESLSLDFDGIEASLSRLRILLSIDLVGVHGLHASTVCFEVILELLQADLEVLHLRDLQQGDRLDRESSPQSRPTGPRQCHSARGNNVVHTEAGVALRCLVSKVSQTQSTAGQHISACPGDI